MLYNHDRYDNIGGRSRDKKELKCGWFVAHFLCPLFHSLPHSASFFSFLDRIACAWRYTDRPSKYIVRRENIINCECLCFCSSSVVFYFLFYFLFIWYLFWSGLDSTTINLVHSPQPAKFWISHVKRLISYFRSYIDECTKWQMSDI